MYDHERDHKNHGDNVRVIVRCRPLNKQEINQGYKCIVRVDESTGVICARQDGLSLEGTSGMIAADGQLFVPKSFTYDHVFGMQSKQVDLYNAAVRPIVDNVLEGYNGTIFAYGQTGTGKTFTMEGDRSIPELKGVIPNSFAHIFGHIAKCGGEKTFLVRCSYLEIYNEEIRDLLSKNQAKRLEIKERPDVGIYVKDLTSVTVSSADEMDKIMAVGNKNRSVGATNMNERSSRSHAIFTITLECSEKGADSAMHVRVGKLNLIDLAFLAADGAVLPIANTNTSAHCPALFSSKGSERQSKTGASGQRLKEATKINLSLSTLGNVISALTDPKATHVPYRNSKLTRLLQDSLGGNSKTLMCANIGCADYNYDETISTLRYASRAKNIVNKAHINEDPKDALLRKFQQEIEFLRQQLAEGGEDGEEESEEDDNNEKQSPSRKKDRKRKKILSEHQMRDIEAEIEEDRKKLLDQSNMDKDERTKLENDLRSREDQLRRAREDQEALVKKLNQIEKKVIIGGENLLEKMEEQARLLEESNRELEERRFKESELRRALEQKQAERLDIEEKYSSLQEEAAGKTKKLRRCQYLLTDAKSELNDIRSEQQREMEGLLDNVRQLSRELSLQMLIIDSFIPREHQELIERYVQWNEEIGDWQLKCIAYTGNNMRKSNDSDDEIVNIFGNDDNDHTAKVASESRKKNLDLSSAYLTYADQVATLRSKMERKSAKKSAQRHLERAKLKALLQ